MANFPRDKLWRNSPSRIRAYRDISELEPIPVGIHELTHEDQTYRFRYVVRVNTFNEETEEDVHRFISLTDDERATKGELLGAAQDAVMDSPIAANETFVDAEIVFALRKG